MGKPQISPITIDGEPVLDEASVERLQTLTDTPMPYLARDLSQLYEDIITGIEEASPRCSHAMEYLNRWVLGKMSTEDTISNLDALGWLDWIFPPGSLEPYLTGEN